MGRPTAQGALLVGATALCLALALGPACEPVAKDPRPVLLYACDNQGILAACGCPSNPSGGFAKRQGLVERYRRTREHVLVVDAGNLFPYYRHPIKEKYLAKAASRAAWDAIAAGEQELQLGVERLRRICKTYRLPIICANVRDGRGELVVPPHVIREVAGLRIGIFAVIAEETYDWPQPKWRRRLTVEPALDAARREVESLAGCDVVVALSHQPIAPSRRLARDVPGISVVVVGKDPKVLRRPQKVGETLLVATGEAGNVLGALTLDRDERGRVRFSSDLTTLSARIPEAKWALDLYWQYVKESKDEPPPDWDETPIPPRYEAAEACKECHEEQYEHWLTTPHAHSYASIKGAGRHGDPECLLCHTMGLGRRGGFVSMAATPRLGRVTCQACHVLTADHHEKKVRRDPAIYISSRLCMSCHGPVQSPDFDYFVYKPKIVHTKPAGDRKQECGRRPREGPVYAYVILGLMLAVLATDLAADAPPPDVLTAFLATGSAAITVMVAGLAISGYILMRRDWVERDEQRFLRRVGLLGKLYRLFVVAAYAVVLFVFDWPALAMAWAGVGDWLVLPLAVTLAPFVLLLVVAWTSLYWADRSLRALMFRRAGAPVAVRRWTLPQYVEFMARQYLLVILVPVLVLLGVADVVEYVVGSSAVATVLNAGVLLTAFLFAGPWVRVCWRTEAMPDCSLRDRLLALGERAGVRVADILVWRTNLSIANGCVIGLVGRLRYILITDALLLSLSPEEVESVFAHEVAHIRHRHVLLYLLMALAGAGVAYLVLAAGFVGVPWLWNLVLVEGEPSLLLGEVVSLGVLAAWWWLGFGFVSRRCEQESDLYAVRATACPVACSPPNAAASVTACARDDGFAHDDAASEPPSRQAPPFGVCEHRVMTFVNALRRIARLNGAAETARGWRHFSIARRCRFLVDVLARPSIVCEAEARLRHLKVLVLVVAIAVALGAAGLTAVDNLLQPDEPEDPARPEDVAPMQDSWIVRLMDRDEVDHLPCRPPQFDHHAHAAADFHDGRLTAFGRGVSAGDDDVAIADPRRHAVAIHAKPERAGLDGPDAGKVQELDDPVRCRRG